MNVFVVISLGIVKIIGVIERARVVLQL